MDPAAIDHRAIAIEACKRSQRPLRLSVKVVPKSSRNEIVEVQADGTWRIKVAAPPEKGKANAELCDFLAREFGVPRSRVEVVAGHASHRKQVQIS
jgi:uncharacterized protein (TIGR00251 family)